MCVVLPSSAFLSSPPSLPFPLPWNPTWIFQNHESSPMLRCLNGLDTPDTKEPTQPLRTGSAWVAHTYLWCGRPCCRPWQDAPLDVRPSGQPAAAFHPSFGCSPPLLPSFLSSPLSSNPPGPLTLLPDNPPNLPARRATHVSLTFRSSDSPNLPTAISNCRPQACVRRMQRRRLHNRTS